MDLQFACADFTFPLLSHEKSLKLIKMLDIDAVDIGFFQDRSHLQPSDVFKNIPGKAGAVKKMLSDVGVQPADLFLQLATDFQSKALNNPNLDIQRKTREAFLKTLEVADVIEAEHITVLPGVLFDEEQPEDSVKRAYDELAWRVDKSNDAGIVLGTEAHLGSFCESPDAAVELIKNVPGLTLTLDYTHFTKLGIPDAEIEILIPLASHFHARGACENRAQTTMVNNTIDYRKVVQAMIKNDYPGFVGLEYVWIEWEHMNEADTVSETIQLRNLIENEYHKIYGEICK